MPTVLLSATPTDSCHLDRLKILSSTGPEDPSLNCQPGARAGSISEPQALETSTNSMQPWLRSQRKGVQARGLRQGRLCRLLHVEVKWKPGVARDSVVPVACEAFRSTSGLWSILTLSPLSSCLLAGYRDSTQPLINRACFCLFRMCSLSACTYPSRSPLDDEVRRRHAKHYWRNLAPASHAMHEPFATGTHA